ncbi:MAG: L-threonine 3-dehydrogenase [Tepidisphaeraceae bacterium]
MIALKKTVAQPGMSLCRDTPVPEIGPRDVLVAVSHAGICGTDRHIYEWDDWSAKRIPVGITIGHEFVGKVAKVGQAVNRVKPGERVSGEGHINCGVCEACRTGSAHICPRVKIIGVDRDGCFAQFISMPEDNIWPVHPKIPDKFAAIFDPLGNAVHTVMSANVAGRSVLITGVGIIGLMAVTVARAAGAATILAVDRDEKRLALARKLGADVAYSAGDADWSAKARKDTDGLGPQVLLEMSGSSKAIRDGFSALRNGGTVAMLGLPSRPVEFDLANDIIFKGATVHGINGRRMFETWYQVQGFLVSGKIDLGPIVTHEIRLDEFERGFKLMQSGEAIKVVMKIPEA